MNTTPREVLCPFSKCVTRSSNVPRVTGPWVLLRSWRQNRKQKPPGPLSWRECHCGEDGKTRTMSRYFKAGTHNLFWGQGSQQRWQQGIRT